MSLLPYKLQTEFLLSTPSKKGEDNTSQNTVFYLSEAKSLDNFLCNNQVPHIFTF